MKTTQIKWLLGFVLGTAILAVLILVLNGQRQSNAMQHQAIQLERQRQSRERAQNILDSL